MTCRRPSTSTTPISPPERCGAHQAFTVQADGQLPTAEQYGPLVIAYRNGAPVRLEELGRVIPGIENDKFIGWFDKTRALMLQVMRQPGTNTVEIVDRVNALLPQLRAQLPPAVALDVFYDRSESIRESVNDVKFTLLLSVGLVVLVIFLFLRNVSATIIPSLALPLSIVGTFAVMSLFGYTHRQPLADGADPGGRLRGGRRHRGAGKHRAPHGNGKAAP